LIQRCKWLWWAVRRPNTTLSKKKTVFRGRQNMTLKVLQEGNTTKKATPLLLWRADLDCWICMSVSPCTILHRQTHTSRWHHRIFFPNILLICISYMVVYILVRLYTYTHYVCVRVKLFQSIKNRCHGKSESIKKTTWQKPIVFGMCALRRVYVTY